MRSAGGWRSWRAAIPPLDALLAKDVVFESPVVVSPQRGTAITAKYLLAAEEVLGTPEFRYVGAAKRAACWSSRR